MDFDNDQEKVEEDFDYSTTNINSEQTEEDGKKD